MQITMTDLEIQRAPFARPFAFKGGAFHEKWNLIVRFVDQETGTEAFGLGGSPYCGQIRVSSPVTARWGAMP